jgi:hypothetical protein
MKTMTQMTDLQSTTALSAPLGGAALLASGAFGGSNAVASFVISQDSARAMGAYAAAHVIDGRALPCSPVVVNKRTENGTVVLVSDKRRAMNATTSGNPANPAVKTWLLRPSGICGAPPG